MALFFTEAWIQRFKDEWNNEKEIFEPLSSIGFNSVIAYGFPGEATPRAFLVITKGKATEAGIFTTGSSMKVNWDLRATSEAWKGWFTSGIGIIGLGLACARGALDFKEGDYSGMLKNPSMAGPFVKSFEVMGRADKKNSTTPVAAATVKHAPPAPIAMPEWDA